MLLNKDLHILLKVLVLTNYITIVPLFTHFAPFERWINKNLETTLPAVAQDKWLN